MAHETSPPHRERFWEPFPLKHRVFLRKFSKSSHFGNVKGPVRHAL